MKLEIFNMKYDRIAQLKLLQFNYHKDTDSWWRNSTRGAIIIHSKEIETDTEAQWIQTLNQKGEINKQN